jgi:excisionase family DNA binding protein
MIRRPSPAQSPEYYVDAAEAAQFLSHPSANFVPVTTEWLTAAEAAAHLKVRPRTLLLWVRQGRVPAHRLSGVRRCVWRFLRSELDAMLTPSSAGAAQEEAC